jgi:hypothetical protein
LPSRRTANVTSFSTSGTKIIYRYEVTDTGNVTLKPVTVTDPMTRPVENQLPDHRPGPRGRGDLHRDLHHHPSRREPRIDQKRWDGHGHRPDREKGHRHGNTDHPGKEAVMTARRNPPELKPRTTGSKPFEPLRGRSDHAPTVRASPRPGSQA